MKKLMSLLLAAVMVLSFAVTAFADDFYVPSVGGDANHGLIRARIRMGNGEYLDDFDHEITPNPYDPSAPDMASDCCLIITHITDVHETALSKDGEEELLDVYYGLKSGKLSLPYAEVGFGGKEMAIIDLYDATFICKEHNEMLVPEGVTIELTLEVPAPVGAKVCAMSYDDGAWTPAVSTVNNNDGSVTVVLEHLCPIVFAVEASEMEDNGSNGGNKVEIEGNPNTGASMAFMGAAALVCGAAVVLGKRK